MVYPYLSIAGTHWLTNVVTMVIRGNTDYVGTPPILEFADLESMKDMESPRILSSHTAFECFPKGFKEGKSKIITISRHPKDVVVSFYSLKLQKEKAVYNGT